MSAVFGVLWTALSTFAVIYLLAAIARPSFFLRSLAIGELAGARRSKWRVWPQGMLTLIGLGFLIYASSYALIAAIPYDWGYHDEDGEWFALRDSIRFLITVVGALYFLFGLDEVAKAILQVKIEQAVRSELLRGYSHSYAAAMDHVRQRLKLADLARPYWALQHQETFGRQVMKEHAQSERIRHLRAK